MSFLFKRITSPVGDLYLIADDYRLHALLFDCAWASYKKRYRPLAEGTSRLLTEAENQLEEYFAGQRREFELPYALEGTEFQKKVWNALTAIPYGRTVSYGHQARMIGRPKAVRAVGGTNGLNPLSIILPCHRVIAQSGHLTGYGGGIKRKEFLLRLEGAIV